MRHQKKLALRAAVRVPDSVSNVPTSFALDMLTNRTLVHVGLIHGVPTGAPNTTPSTQHGVPTGVSSTKPSTLVRYQRVDLSESLVIKQQQQQPL